MFCGSKCDPKGIFLLQFPFSLVCHIMCQKLDICHPAILITVLNNGTYFYPLSVPVTINVPKNLMFFKPFIDRIKICKLKIALLTFRQHIIIMDQFSYLTDILASLQDIFLICLDF